MALETFRADVEEGKTKLDRLQEKLDEVEAHKLETTNAIQVAERQVQVQKNSTHAEVFRLKGSKPAVVEIQCNADPVHQMNWKRFRISTCCTSQKSCQSSLNSDMRQLMMSLSHARIFALLSRNFRSSERRVRN